MTLSYLGAAQSGFNATPQRRPYLKTSTCPFIAGLLLARGVGDRKGGATGVQAPLLTSPKVTQMEKALGKCRFNPEYKENSTDLLFA